MDASKANNKSLMVVAMLAATTMIAHHVAGKATRDALFLTSFDVTELPKMMMVSAFLSVVAVLGMSRVLPRLGPAYLIPRIYTLSAILFGVQWVIMGVQPAIIAVTLYIHISVFGAILISGFWSVINERFDPYTAKRIIARLAAAATLGGLLGGLAAKTVASAADTRSILIMLGAMHLFCALALGWISRGQPHAEEQSSTTGSILAPLKRNPMIRNMALLALMVATTAAFLDYLLKSTAANTLPKEDLITFFSYFYMGVGLGSFLLQTFVGNRALRWLGLGGAMAAWPLVILGGGMLALVVRHIATIVLLRGGTTLFYNSFFRAGFEVLYTPVPPADKRTGKVLIDVGADRSGDMLGSLLLMGILLLPVATEEILLTSAMVLSGVCLLLIVFLQRAYVRQLADNLRSGAQTADDIPIADATTQHTVAMTQTALERDKLLRDIARSRGSPQAAAEPGAAVAPATPVARPLPMEPLLEAIQDLRSDDPDRIRSVLLTRTASPELLPHLIRLLRNEDVLRDVFKSMRPLASTSVGQLIDALLDARQHPVIRRRLPLVLGQADNQRAVNGLVDALADDDRDVRYRCAQALKKIQRNFPRLDFHAAQVLQMVKAEVAAIGRQNPPSDFSHLFDLLGLIYGQDEIELCYGALRSGELALRGTALEYLENTLPSDLRETLWPLVAGGESAPKSNRSPQDIAGELLRAAPFARKAKSVDATGELSASSRGSDPLSSDKP